MTRANPAVELGSPGVDHPAGTTDMRYHYSPEFPDVMTGAGCSLLVSTYQAGQLVAVGVAESRLQISLHPFDQAMGVAVGSDRIAVASKGQIWSLHDHSELAGQVPPEGRYDRCFLTRNALVTGEIRCHEVAWGLDADGQPELWIVNTLFSCLAGIDTAYSFVPRWKPRFISRLAAEDRCHLNGLAMREGKPAFVSVMAQTDDPAGWRRPPVDTGAVLDVPSGETVTTGLAMPHSPRWHQDELFVLNSGFGRLERVDVPSGDREVVALVPGYARGLAIHRGLAFIGLSRIRETAVFGGVPLAAHHEHLKCGVGVIDLESGKTVATLQFASAVEEIFDVQIVPNAGCLTFGGTPDADEQIWIVPPPLA